MDMDIDTGPYFKFFFSAPDKPRPVVALRPHRVGAILRREGARMIGRPLVRGFEIVAFGRFPSGEERKFTLDAETGGILTVTLSRPAPERPRPRVNGDEPPDIPLGRPVHPAGPLDADHLGTPPPPSPPEEVLPPPPPKQVEEPPPPPPMIEEGEIVEAPPERRPDPNAALSPIKPLKGAPKIEKLPQ
ncbi:hypothetical protein GGD83_002606 [Rhodoblastus sphagnicola]|nr:hypothetical protein [Rhodoblastus sphagnicola]MBB4198797.1 hypothetical protein [Rhodoblastus sphagnicola]